MEKYKLPLAALSILIAVALPLLNAINMERLHKSYPVVKFDIEPYDPRDLLYGHYMTFRIKWNWKKDHPAPACQSEECCVCVQAGDVNPEVYPAACPPRGEALPACTHILKGDYYAGFSEAGQPPNHNFIAGIERYYVDESLALPLENLFRGGTENFSIGLGMAPAGKPVVEKLYVGGKALRDYVEAHGGSIPEPKEPETSETPVP